MRIINPLGKPLTQQQANIYCPMFNFIPGINLLEQGNPQGSTFVGTDTPNRIAITEAGPQIGNTTTLM